MPGQNALSRSQLVRRLGIFYAIIAVIGVAVVIFVVNKGGDEKAQPAQISQLRSEGPAGRLPLITDEPVRRVEARLALSEVRRAVAQLPPDQRSTLMLVTVEGLSYKQAADVTGVPVGTVMSRLARARVALQQLLEAGGGSRSARDAEA